MNTVQAVTNATALKRELTDSIEEGREADTLKIISKVSNNPVEVAYLMKYCHMLDAKYQQDTVTELLIELGTRQLM